MSAQRLPPLRRRDFLGALGALGAAACGSSSSGPAEPTLDALVAEKMAEAYLPGLAVAVVRDGAVAFTREFGLADLAASRPVAKDTSFFLASISKTTTGAAMMTLVESGAVSLDADVNGYLSFPVRNPAFPDAPITLRHLMTHTSSIQENAAYLVSLSKPGDPAMSLQQLLEPYLVPGGATYVAGESYGPQAPGTLFHYSNFGAALVGLILERVTGEPFPKAVHDAVFAPLALAGTSFLLADLEPTKVATPYTYISGIGQRAEVQSSVPYLPATALRTPAAQLARFLACVIRGGELDGVRILKTETVREMTRAQVAANDEGNGIDEQGLLWERRAVAGAPCVGHGGSYYGASTRMHYRERDGLGVITLANGDVHLRISSTHAEEMEAYGAIEARLYRDGGRP